MLDHRIRLQAILLFSYCVQANPASFSGMHKVAILASAINCKYMRGTIRSDIRVGMRVRIVLKKDQRSGALTEGVVENILTSSGNHPHGRKVRLQGGQVGRVKEILS